MGITFAIAVFGDIFFQFFCFLLKGKVWFPILLFILALRFSEEKVATAKKRQLAQQGLIQAEKKSSKKMSLSKQKSGLKKLSS